MSDEELQAGDDANIHGEEAYALWGEGEKYESRHNSVYGVEEFPRDVPKGGQVEMASEAGLRGSKNYLNPIV